MLRKIWTDFISLILRRPSRYQVASLCWQPASDAGGVKVLLISSLTTGRWILPKGWPQPGKDGAATALQEAWEEAGVRIGPEPAREIGRYSYHKRLQGNVPVHTLVDVYAIRTDRLLEQYPEAGRRKREWFAPAEAATLVQEPELAALLRESESLLQAH